MELMAENVIKLSGALVLWINENLVTVTAPIRVTVFLVRIVSHF
jgi:hypothetical protein